MSKYQSKVIDCDNYLRKEKKEEKWHPPGVRLDYQCNTNHKDYAVRYEPPIKIVRTGRVRQHKSCCIPGCFTSENSNEKISYHRFPKNPETRKAWALSIGLTANDMDQIDDNIRLCSKHFAYDQYRSQPSTNQRAGLKKTAVPTIFSFVSNQAIDNILQDHMYALHEGDEKREPKLQKKMIMPLVELDCSNYEGEFKIGSNIYFKTKEYSLMEKDAELNALEEDYMRLKMKHYKDVVEYSRMEEEFQKMSSENETLQDEVDFLNKLLLARDNPSNVRGYNEEIE